MHHAGGGSGGRQEGGVRRGVRHEEGRVAWKVEWCLHEGGVGGGLGESGVGGAVLGSAYESLLDGTLPLLFVPVDLAVESAQQVCFSQSRKTKARLGAK